MTELEKFSVELEQLQRNLNYLMYINDRMPKVIVQADIDELLDEVKHLRGFIDCMIESNII